MTEEEFQAIKMHLGRLIQQGVRWGGENAKVEQISQIMAMASSKELSKSDFEDESIKEKETLNISKQGESEKNTIQEKKNQH